MNKLLFLDDIRQPEHCALYCPQNIYLHGNWTVVRNYKDFTGYIEHYFAQHKILPDLISFDHDLSEIHYQDADKAIINYDSYTEKTGFSCAKWLTDFCMDNGIKHINFLCHSMNPAGKKNIESILNQFNRLNKK